ncbi:MAG TPA: esterase family protein, partial [Chitinophagaceae bacterium]|nr:esterase family protein [Chitinophagaceae bacterium]
MIKRIYPAVINFTLISILCINSSHAATVDTISITSTAMNKTFKCVVIKPTLSKKERTTPLPVVYLLHGYSGGYNNWIRRVPELTTYADQFKLIIVCPDGGHSSWYFD